MFKLPTIDYKVQPPRTAPQERYLHPDTPGWTSLAHPETLQGQPGPEQNRSILNQLKKLQSIELSSSRYSRIRASNITHQHTLRETNKENDSSQMQRLSSRSEKRLETTALHTESRTQQSLRVSNLSSKHKRTGTIVKNQKRKTKEKRFQQITVHEHLYQQGKRQQTKRVMRQILDLQYQKQRVLTFKPEISQTSHALAQQKFSKMKEKQELENQLSEVLDGTERGKQARKPVSRKNFEETEHQKHLVLNRLFDVLASSGQIFNKQTLKTVIEDLPLVFLKIISPILQKVYQGKEFTWLQFLGAVNDRNVVPNKEALVQVTDRWLSRLERKQEHETKDETRTHE